MSLQSVVQVEELVVKVLGLGERNAPAEEQLGCSVDNRIILGEGPLDGEIDDWKELVSKGSGNGRDTEGWGFCPRGQRYNPNSHIRSSLPSRPRELPPLVIPLFVIVLGMGCNTTLAWKSVTVFNGSNTCWAIARTWIKRLALLAMVAVPKSCLEKVVSRSVTGGNVRGNAYRKPFGVPDPTSSVMLSKSAIRIEFEICG